MRLSFIYFLIGISIFNLNGQTVFGPPQTIIETISTVDGATSTYAADIDGDGDLDILSASFFDDKIAWYENDGLGNFVNQSIISTQADGAESVFAADADGDGDIDVFSASTLDDKIAWYRNDGNGNFSNQIVLTTEAERANHVFVADLDNDNDMDVLSSSSGDSKIAWYQNDGNGNFSNQIIISNTTLGALTVYAADIDNDGDNDVFSTSYGDDLSWHKNDGNGNFGTEIVISSNTNGVRSVKAADFNNDGHLDLVTASHHFLLEDQVKWFKNNGNGTFADPTIITTIARGANSVYTGDLDSDGDIDVLSASFIDNKIAHYLNDGNGIFSDQVVISSIASEAYSVFAADIDADGKLDVLSASRGDDKIAWYKNEGSGNFTTQPFLTTTETSANGAVSVYATDLDNDGDMDVLSASFDDDKIAWYENDGIGNFASQVIITTLADGATKVFAADLDGDGDQDVLSASPEDNKLAWYENNGNGGFGSQSVISTETVYIYSVHAADLDGDGDIDVLSAAEQNGAIAWYDNDGNGNFLSRTIISEVSDDIEGQDVIAVDINNDGDNDVISAIVSPSSITINSNDGNGNFTAPITASTEVSYPSSIFVADLDGDGDQDIVSASRNDDKIAWYPNDGNGNFPTQVIVDNSLGFALSVYAKDLDNDGDIDIISASASGDIKITWYENDGNGNFSNQLVVSGEIERGNSIFSADLDGDGDNDILSASGDEGKIAWYENLLEEEITKVSGQVYWDKNQDGIFNNDDEAFTGINLTMQPDNTDFYTNSNGEFIAFTLTEGSHTLSSLPPTIIDCNGIVQLNPSSPIDGSFTFQFDAFAELEQDYEFVSPVDVCKTVSGIVYNDENDNGLQDTGENGLGGIMVSASEIATTYTSSDGSYSFEILNAESTDITIELTNTYSSVYCTGEATIYSQTFPTNNQGQSIQANSGNISNANFGVSIEQQNTFDVGLYSLNVYFGDEAGKFFYAQMDFKANGIITEPCTLRVEHDPLVIIRQASIPPSASTETYIEWVFPAGSAPDWFCMQMEWYLDSAAIEGDTLHWEATYDCPPGIDGCPQNNIIIRDIVITEGVLRLANQDVQLYSMRPEGYMPEIVGKEEALSYVITFQNPLPTTAYDITIIDTLPDELDFSTITRPFSSFSDYDLTISEDGIVRVEMKGIDLTDAEADELNSYGFMQFNIKLKEDLEDGAVIPNQATVFFNGISPIQSNEIIHRLDISSPVINHLDNKIEAEIFPNPFIQQTTFRLSQFIDYSYDLRVFNIAGKQVGNYPNNSESSVVIEKGNLPSGLYILNLYESGQSEVLSSYKLVVK